MYSTPSKSPDPSALYQMLREAQMTRREAYVLRQLAAIQAR